MEVFPPDDNQQNEVGSEPTASQLDEMKVWNDSLASLEIALQAACDNKDGLSIPDSSQPVSSLENVEEKALKPDAKRKWETDLVDTVESTNKLKRLNNMVLDSADVSIDLIGSSSDSCDKFSNLLSMVKSEDKDDLSKPLFDLATDNIVPQPTDSINNLKSEAKEETEEHSDFDKIDENKCSIFSDVKNICLIGDKLEPDIKVDSTPHIKNEDHFADEINTENKSNFFMQNDLISYNIKKENDSKEFTSDIQPETTALSHTGSAEISSVSESQSNEKNDDPNVGDKSNSNNSEESLEKKKEKKEKKEESDKNKKIDDKKKKKFERCNIRDIKLEDELDAVTLSAQKEEQERIRRLQEAQMRALQERLQQIEVEKEALSQLFSQPPDDAPNLFDSSTTPESETTEDTKESIIKTENDVVLLESSDDDKKPPLQDELPPQIEENIIDISSSSSGNESDSDDSDKKDDDIMVLSDEGEAETDGTAEDPNNSGAHTNDFCNLPDEEGRVLINVGHPPEDPDIFLAPQIAKVIKPHQIGGIRFLYDNVVEDLERYKSSSGFGCILAHSMGLGKTVQVVSFVDVFLRHTPATLVLCIVPINTIQNWKAEFDMWVPPTNSVEDIQISSGEIRPRDYNVYTLNENFKTMAARAALIAEWRKQGGVLLMGYEMYRMLALRKMPKIPLKKSKRLKKQELAVEPETNEQIKKFMDEMYEHIVIPGPDLVICDEGHRIKNSLASTSMALKSIKTRRRVVLTGYPLQNNLLEYWCMVDFVRPNYLGSRAEFCNMFERPISNGQCIDSTPRDRQLMRFRSHVLHSLLVGFVQRRGHSVLRAVLPKKEEHVLLIRMTPIQRQLYKCFVKDLLYVQQATNPLKLFAVCCKIWNHPDILYKLLQEKRAQEDIDLDIDITLSSTSGVSGSGCVRKRATTQSKSKALQRPLKAIQRNLKPQPMITASDVKTEPQNCDQQLGNIQPKEEVKFTPHDVCKTEYGISHQANISPQKEFSQQNFQNQYTKSPAQHINQQNFHLSGQNYNNSNQFMPPSNTHGSTGTGSMQYPHSSTLQHQYGQQQPQYPQENSQTFSLSNNQISVHPKVEQDSSACSDSISHVNFQTNSQVPPQTITPSYSQDSDAHKQLQQTQSQTQFSKQKSNQDINFPLSPQSANQKNVSSYSPTSTSQSYSTQMSKQSAYSAKQLQYSEQQPLQFTQQNPTNINASQSFSQISNPLSHVDKQNFSTQPSFQHSPPHSQFSQNQASQYSQQSSPSQQFSQGFAQSSQTEQFSQQNVTPLPSPTQTKFPQSSPNQVYNQAFSQQTSEFSTSSHVQYQQQNSESFNSLQTPPNQFSANSFSEPTTSFTDQASMQPFSQTSFPQSYGQSSQYSQQNTGLQIFPSQQNSGQLFSPGSQSSSQTGYSPSPQQSSSQSFSGATQQSSDQNCSPQSQQGSNQGNYNSSQTFSQHAAQGSKSSNKIDQSYTQSLPKPTCKSPTPGANQQQKFSQQAFSSQQSSESQFSQIGSFTSQPQTDMQTFSPQNSQISSLQFTSQIPNYSQFNPQNKSVPAYNQSNQYPQSGTQGTQYNQSQQFAQQSSQYSQPSQTSPLQSKSQPSLQTAQDDLFSLTSTQFSSSIQPFTQGAQPSQTSQTGQNAQQFNQQSNFSQLSPPMSQQFSSQLQQPSSQYSLSAQQSQFSHQPMQSPQQNQSAQSPQQGQTSQQNNQLQQQHGTSQPFSQQQSNPSPSQQFNQQSSQQYNQLNSPSASQSFSTQNLQTHPFSQSNQNSQTYSQSGNTNTSVYKQPSQQYNQLGGQATQQYPQKPLQGGQQYSQPSHTYQQSSLSYNQQSIQSPQHFSQHSSLSPQQFPQPVQSPQQFSQQPTPSPQQFSQATSPQYGQPVPSPQQYNQQPVPSPQQFGQQPTPSPQQFGQQSTSQQFGRAASPQQYGQQPVPSPQQFGQQATPSPQQFGQQPIPSPQQFAQHTATAPQSYGQLNSAPQQFGQQPPSASQQFTQQSTSAPQSFGQQNPSQQFGLKSTSAQQQFNQQSSLSPQFGSQSTQSSSSQQYGQQSTSQQYGQQSTPTQQYGQQSTPTQQYGQQSTTSQQFGSQSSASTQPFGQQSSASTQPFGQQSTGSSQQFGQQPSASQQFTHQSATSQQFEQQTSSQNFGQDLPTQQYGQQQNSASQQFGQQNTSSQQFGQQQTNSSQQFGQQQTNSSQQFGQQQTTPSQQFGQQQTTPSQQFGQPNASSQQFGQQPNAPSQQFGQQPNAPSQQFGQQPNTSSQQFGQQSVTSPQYGQQPSPQQFGQQPTSSTQQYGQQSISSPQQFPQQSTPSSQQFGQQSAQSSQFSQPTIPSQQYGQQPVPSPQFSQTTDTSHQFSQPNQSISQYAPQNQQNSLVGTQFSQQSNQASASFSQLTHQQYNQTQSQQFNSFSQISNSASTKGSFQTEYQNQLQSNFSSQQGMSAQSMNQQQTKQVSRGGKSKSRAKSCQPIMPQNPVQHTGKQPPSFSVQTFQNNMSVSQRQTGQQGAKSIQSNNPSFQSLDSSIAKQDNLSIQHIKQDSPGNYPAKCSKAILQVKPQMMASDSVKLTNLQNTSLRQDSVQIESDMQNSANSDTTVMPYKDRSDSSINYEWAIPIMKDYVLGVLENSHKMMVLFVIIAETLQVGDKLLVFSQSLSTLDLLEQFLGKIQVPHKSGETDEITTETWCRNKNYFRLDGSTSAQEREKLINEFNRNDSVSLFLLSTRAGCLGINLVGANRIVVMDASWNPCHDAQAVCRIYRYGQKKQCHIYRLVTDNSLEKRIYDRQVNKQGMSDRVVDELNPESNFTWKDVTTLIQDDEDDGPVQELSKFATSYTDKVLKYLVSEMSPSLSKEPFEHESLLLDRKDLKLTKQEKRLAKQSYEMAKRANMINIRTTYTYLPSGSAGGGQFIINNKQCQWVGGGGTTIRVLPNQTGNTRSGTTATPITASPSLMSSLFKQGVMVQKLTMPSNVSIPVLTPGAPPVVIPAGQDVLVLRTPKGVYLRLPDGRIIAVQLPPSLLAKTQFRPNVVTHFRPAGSKGGNASPTVINTPRGQSIGIIKQTLQCGGTVRYLGPRGAAGSSQNTSKGTAPEVIDLSDDDEPSSRKNNLASNASTNSSESDSGSIDQDKIDLPSILPGKQITIRKLSPGTSLSAAISKDKCEIPQVLSKNKQITILPINPSTQQNRQKLAPQLAQPVRVQQMLLQPQQGKKKTFQKTTPKIQVTPVLSSKNIRPHITITQPALSSQSQKVRHSISQIQLKSSDLKDNLSEENKNSPSKSSSDESSLPLSEKNPGQHTSSPLDNVSHILQNNKNISISLSEPSKTNSTSLPESLASLTNKLNPNLQISSVPHSESPVMADLLPQKMHYNTNSGNSNSQTQIVPSTISSISTESKSPQQNKAEISLPQHNLSQNINNSKVSLQQTNFSALQPTSMLPPSSNLPHTSEQMFQPTSNQQPTANNQKPHAEHSLQYSSQDHSSQSPRLPPHSPQSPRMPSQSPHHFQITSPNQQTSRKRKSSKQATKKSQQQHGLGTQSHHLSPQSDSPQQFHHSQLPDHHLPENHFPNFSHHVPNPDFPSFPNFSSRKSHIQHPQPLHPLQHTQEHALPPHLQHMSHLYPVPPHLTGNPLTDMQPPAPRAWPVPQPPVSSFHPFSQSSPYYTSEQESGHFSFQSSFPLPPSAVASNAHQSESNISSGPSGDKSSRINSSDV